MVIIGIVLALTVGGFAWLYSTSKSPAANTANGNRAANAASTPRTQATVAANAPAGASPVYAIGQPSASVTIEEFADFQCPSCATAHPVMKEIQGAYAGNKNVRFIFRHLPLSIHDKSMDAAAAVEHLKQAEPDGDPFRKLLLARAYEKAGDKAAAKKAYAEIVAFNINNLERALAYPEAKKRLAAL